MLSKLKPAKPNLASVSERAGVELQLATADDAQAIHDIASRCYIGHLKTLNRGFLLFPLSPQDYALIASTAHPFVVCLNARQQIIGFICGFEIARLDAFYAACQQPSTVALLQTISREARRRGDSDGIIIHQMALAPNNQGRGLGVHYFRGYAATYRKPIYGVVKTGPTPNPRRSFWRALGCKEIGIVRLTAAELHGSPNASDLNLSEWQWVLMKHETKKL